MKNAIKLTVGLLLLGLTGFMACQSNPPTSPKAEPLAQFVAGIGINGHLEKGEWTAPYIVTAGPDTLGAFWTIPEAQECAAKHNRWLRILAPANLNPVPEYTEMHYFLVIYHSDTLTTGTKFESVDWPTNPPAPSDTLGCLLVTIDEMGYWHSIIGPLSWGPPQ